MIKKKTTRSKHPCEKHLSIPGHHVGTYIMYSYTPEIRDYIAVYRWNKIYVCVCGYIPCLVFHQNHIHIYLGIVNHREDYRTVYDLLWRRILSEESARRARNFFSHYSLKKNFLCSRCLSGPVCILYTSTSTYIQLVPNIRTKYSIT